MVVDSEIQKGFKVTDLGLIPEGWHLHLIQTLIDERYILSHLDGNHGELYPRSHEFKEAGVPYIVLLILQAASLILANANFYLKKEH